MTVCTGPGGALRAVNEVVPSSNVADSRTLWDSLGLVRGITKDLAKMNECCESSSWLGKHELPSPVAEMTYNNRPLERLEANMVKLFTYSLCVKS